MKVCLFLMLSVVASISSVDAGCCWKVSVARTKGYGKISNNAGMYGVYKMDSGWVNGKPHYTSVNGKYAIAYCKESDKDQWVIQTRDDDRRGDCHGVAYTNDDHSCVSDVKYTWHYLSANSGWLLAEKSLSVWCET